MFIFLTVTLFFQFIYRVFTSREMRVILNERALEPAFLAAGQCTCALVFQPCRFPRFLQSRSQRLRSFWSAPRNQDLWANQCQNPAIRNLIGCCILPEVSLNRRFQRQEIWKDIRNWAKQKTQSKCHQMCIQFFAAKKHEKIISARGSHD